MDGRQSGFSSIAQLNRLRNPPGDANAHFQNRIHQLPKLRRTLFDLQETTAKIRSVTSHLKGVKIGIMGCIVNGPGEMADADYGYVGTGPGKITLYKEKEVVERNVPEDRAVDALVDLIRSHGDWVEPVGVLSRLKRRMTSNPLDSSYSALRLARHFTALLERRRR